MAPMGDMPLILASASTARRTMLANVGVAFTVEAAAIDERAVEADLGSDDPALVARRLAEAKALDVSRRRPGALVIGADQTLNIGRERLTKSADLAQVRTTLLRLRGQTHHLHSGVALAHDGRLLWSIVDSAALTMRVFSDGFVDDYIAAEGSDLCACVGAFKLESKGLQLFARIDGDFFTILGLPLLPLLAELRARGALAT
jgi:septum formation protein